MAMKRHKRWRELLRWLVAGMLLAGALWGVRRYLFASYRISTAAMEEALRPGDCIVVNKLRGIGGTPARNRVVLFTSPLRRDSAARPLFVSRLVGMPGDTLRISATGYQINGVSLARSPRALGRYFVEKTLQPTFLQLVKRHAVPLREVRAEWNGFTLTLTPFEYYTLSEALSPAEKGQLRPLPAEAYTLIVPRRGQAYRLTPAALQACREAILTEAGEKALFRDGKLYLDGRETNFYFFRQDYYWVLSDNADDAVDSRHLGFIPASHLVGNAWFCWYSHDRQRLFRPIR